MLSLKVRTIKKIINYLLINLIFNLEIVNTVWKTLVPRSEIEYEFC